MDAIEDSLTRIPSSQWTNLLSKFEGFPGKTARAAIITQILAIEKYPDFPVTIYSPYNNPDDGIIIIWNMIDSALEIGAYSMKEDTKKISKALHQTKQINWNFFIRFCCMMPKIYESVNDTLIKLGLSLEYSHTYYANIALDKAKTFEIRHDSDIRVEVIGPEFAAEMDEGWPHRYPGSIKYFEFMLKHGFGLAILGADDNKLRGYTLTSVYGAIHALFINSEYRNRGYGQLLVKVLGKKLANENRDVFGFIVTENTPSKEMFLRLGFEFLTTTLWIVKYA